MTPEEKLARLDLLDLAPCAFQSIGADGLIREVNTTWLRWLGYEREEVEGKLPAVAILTEGSRVLFARCFPLLQRDGRLEDRELTMRRKDGSTFVALLNASAVYDADGRFLYSRSGFVDITRRKRAEEHNQRLLEAAPDPTIVVDPAGRIEFANARVEGAFGYSQSELIGQPVELLVPLRSCEAHTAPRPAFTPLTQRFSPSPDLTLHGRRKDGSRFPIEVSVSCLEFDDGSHVVAAIRDISERLRVQCAAQLASERLVDAIESIDDAFAIIDADGFLVMHNDAYRQLFVGLLPEPLIGRHMRELALAVADAERVESSQRDDYVAARMRMVAAGRTVQEFVRFGRVFRVVMHRARDGATVLVVSDRSEERRREEELRKASAAKSDFLSAMSHELRTPLNAVLGFSQLLQRDRKTPLAPRHVGMVEHILRSGEHLQRLIDEVLDLARIENGGVSISIEPIAVAEVAAQVMTTLAPMAARADIELVVTPALEAVGHVMADRTRLAQTLLNFGSNAIKYGKKGGRATLTASRAGPDRVRVTVVDDGLGIPVDKQERLFQPFYRAGQEFSAVEGTGIGLAISRRLVELMGGSVGFRSSPGAGSEFWAELAAVQDRPPAATAVRVGPESRLVADPGPTIVYIEDHPANIAFIRELLADLTQLELMTAPNAEIGLELIRAHRPSAVILDINLPGMDGFEALRLLQSWPETRDIPVIALSAAAMARDIKCGEAAGFFRYLTKPVKVDQLIAALEQVLACPPAPTRSTHE